MSCRICRTSFCWGCVERSCVCNRIVHGGSQGIRRRSRMDFFVKFYDRYMNHMQSLSLERKLHSAIEEKMAILQQQGLTAFQVRNVLINLRRDISGQFLKFNVW